MGIHVGMGGAVPVGVRLEGWAVVGDNHAECDQSGFWECR